MLKPAGSSSFGWDEALHASPPLVDSRLIDFTSSRAKCSTRPQRSIPTSCASILCNLPLTTIPSAETFVLRDGIVVSGKLQSMDAQDVGIERCGRVEHFAREEVKSINLESTSGAEACSASSQPKLELPAGFSITLRTVDHIDSLREPAGQVFRAVLETSIEVDGRILVSSGASIVIKLVPAADSA